MFRFARKPSSGSHSQCLAKITNLVQCRYIEVLQTSVLWLNSMTCEACVCCALWKSIHHSQKRRHTKFPEARCRFTYQQTITQAPSLCVCLTNFKCTAIFIHNATVKPWGTNLNTDAFIEQQMAS